MLMLFIKIVCMLSTNILYILVVTLQRAQFALDAFLFG